MDGRARSAVLSVGRGFPHQRAHPTGTALNEVSAHLLLVPGIILVYMMCWLAQTYGPLPCIRTPLSYNPVGTAI